MVFHVFAALAEFIRELIVDGTNEGLVAARASGQRLGWPSVPCPPSRSAKPARFSPDRKRRCLRWHGYPGYRVQRSTNI
ncbi:hypothetical protein [Nocardia vinacea]|uniref:hypothetical protein n=1 Tax=Nocardia vinacea TaxID=96468 RepID=UPI003F4CE031